MKFSLPGVYNWIIALAALTCLAGYRTGRRLAICRPVFGSDTGWDGFFS